MFRKKAFWISVIIVLVLAAGGGYACYTYVYLPGQEPPAPAITTAQVRRGDLVISVSGSGALSPASESNLRFETGGYTGGYLDEVLVKVGDRVQEGDVLARLKTDDLELAVAEAEIKVRKAQLDLTDASEEVTHAELADARAALQSAQAALAVAKYTYDTAQNSDLDAAVRAHLIEFQWSVDQYRKLENGHNVSQDRLEDAQGKWASAEADLNIALREADMEQLDAWNQVDQAQNRVYQAQKNLELLQSGPTTSTVMQAELKLNQATLALDNARAALEAAELRAPFDGAVVDVTAIPGEYVGTAPIITLADLGAPLLQFWVEESDMSGVAAGYRVEVIFEALPDETFTGEVIRVDPALVTVGNTLAVQAWARLDLSSHPANLLGGMNAEVEVISAESRDALLAPVQALRELGAGQYAVLVVQPDGEMVLRPVEVGLQNLVYAEIISGLESGETVSTGVQESTEVSTEQPAGAPMGVPGGPFIMEGPRGP